MVRLKVEGEIDLHTVEPLRSRVVDAIGANPKTIIVLDASELTYLDSTGLGMLVHVRKLAQATGGDVRLEDASGRVLRILQVAGMDRYLMDGAEAPDQLSGPSD